MSKKFYSIPKSLGEEIIPLIPLPVMSDLFERYNQVLSEVWDFIGESD
jgi:hypothetical protein